MVAAQKNEAHCIVCSCIVHGMGADDPRGKHGLKTNAPFVAEEHGMKGNDVPCCWGCHQESDLNAKGLTLAKKVWWGKTAKEVNELSGKALGKHFSNVARRGPLPNKREVLRHHVVLLGGFEGPNNLHQAYYDHDKYPALEADPQFMYLVGIVQGHIEGGERSFDELVKLYDLDDSFNELRQGKAR